MSNADFADIPGTVLFDAQQARRGYGLNQFCMSLMNADNRKRFKADEAHQGVAVDAEHFYAITNAAIGKYRKDTGERVGGWLSQVSVAL